MTVTNVALAASLVAAISMPGGAGEVHTIAGTGNAGYIDGAALSASFLAPEAVAIAADGSIAIADTGAQRVRMLSGGSVSTIAGSGTQQTGWDFVEPSAGLGTASQPLFDAPSGLAYLADGTLLIADSNHHCIRALKNGSVAPFAGSSVSGTQDGTRATATFVTPNALAVDAAGDVFVADLHGGLREITGDAVRTIALPKDAGSEAIGVTTYGAGPTLRVFVSTYAGLVTADAALQTTLVARSAEGMRPFGYPAGLVALRDDAIAFTDARDNTVRLLRMPVRAGDPPQVEPIAVDVTEDGAFAGDGYSEGPVRGTRFSVPQGIARAPDGSLIVADTGNRRIRKVDGVAVRLPYAPSSGSLPAGRTWIVGGPPSYYDTLWSTSIAGALAPARPNADALEYDDASPAASGEALSRASKAGGATRVWLVTTRDLSTLGAAALTARAKAAAGDGSLVLATMPLAGEAETRRDFSMESVTPEFDFAAARAAYKTLVESAAAAQVPLLDLAGPISREATHEDPYETMTRNLGEGGRATVASAIAAYLSGTRPAASP